MDFTRIAFDHTWQLTALIVVAWVLSRLFARQRPHLAYVLWLVVLLKAVTPPIWSSPTGVFSWAQASMVAESDKENIMPQPIIEVDDLNNEVLAVPQPHDFTPSTSTSQETVLAGVVASEAEEPPTTNLVLVAVIAAWCLGSATAFFVTVIRSVNCMRLLRRSPYVDRPDLERLIVSLSQKLCIKRKVRLLITCSRIGPAVIGLFRPLVVIPEVIVRGKSADELEAIIAHELLHIRRGDLWLGVVQVCAKAVWWFHPLVWWAARMSTREAERCCDEEVVGELRCDPKRYARNLLEVLELKQTLRTIPAFPGMKPVEVTTQRLERIMKLGQGCHKQTPRWCWMILALLAICVLPGAAYVLATDDASPSTPREWKQLQVEASATEFHASTEQQVQIEVEILQAPATQEDDAISGWTWFMPDVDEPDFDPLTTPKLALPTDGAFPKAESGRITETQLPSVYMVVDNQRAKQLRKQILKRRGGSKVATPKVNVFSGQAASIADASQRPFVVGIKEDGEPKIRVVTEGTQLHVRPLVFEDNRVGLTYSLQLSRVVDVQTTNFTLQGIDGPLAIQIPKVESTNTSASLTFASGSTLVIGGLKTESKKGKEQSVFVMLKATAMPSTESTEPLKLGTGVDSDAGIVGAIQLDERASNAASREAITEKLYQDISVRITQESLTDAIERIGRQINVPIIIDTEDIAAEGISQDRKVTLTVQSIQAHKALTLLLDSNDLRYVIEHGKVVVKGKSSEPLIAVCYNVADILKHDLDYWQPEDEQPAEFGTSRESRAFEILTSAITTRVDPDSWKSKGGRGQIEAIPTNLALVVSQTASVHQDVDKFLARIRQRLGLAETEKKSIQPWQRREMQTDERLYAKTYAVADLVVPIPNAIRHEVMADDGKKLANGRMAEFDKLTELIKTTIEPHSWSVNGGTGRIQAFPTNFSLVVVQSNAIHSHIADLLQQLRRLQDLQITIEARLLSIPTSMLEPSELPGFFTTDEPKRSQRIGLTTNDDGPTLLSDIETFFLVQVTQQEQDARLVAAPKVTLFNGQQAKIETQTNANTTSAWQFEAVCSEDRKSVHLRVATNAEAKLAEIPMTTVKTGNSLLLPLNKADAAAWIPNQKPRVETVPYLGELPYIGELFRNEIRPVECTSLLLITPRVIEVREEELEVHDEPALHSE